jgi:hypothetical protein
MPQNRAAALFFGEGAMKNDRAKIAGREQNEMWQSVTAAVSATGSACRGGFSHRGVSLVGG